MNLFLAAETVPFGVAFALMLALGVLEAIGLALSFSPSAWLDNLLPEPAVDAGVEGVLGWLHVGRVPSLVLLVLFLAGFALGGYGVQLLARGVIGGYLPSLAAAVPAVACGVLAVRSLGAVLARVIPRDESSAISEAEFVGRVALVTAASARKGLAAQARLRDGHGRSHFVLVEPDAPGLVLRDGMEVLVVKKSGSVYRVIENPHASLV